MQQKHQPHQKSSDHTCCRRLRSTALRRLAAKCRGSFVAMRGRRFSAARHAATSSVDLTTAACNQEV